MQVYFSFIELLVRLAFGGAGYLHTNSSTFVTEEMRASAQTGAVRHRCMAPGPATCYFSKPVYFRNSQRMNDNITLSKMQVTTGK